VQNNSFFTSHLDKLPIKQMHALQFYQSFIGSTYVHHFHHSSSVHYHRHIVQRPSITITINNKNMSVTILAQAELVLARSPWLGVGHSAAAPLPLGHGRRG